MKKIIWVLLILGVVWYLWPAKQAEIRNVKNANWNIVVFGDSLSYGKGTTRDKTYPALLEKSLGRPVINLGHNGETAVHAVQRIEEALTHNPYMVLIEFGGNDLMRSEPFEQTTAAMIQMVEAVQAAGAIAVVVDTGGSPLMGRYSKAYKKIARERGAVFVPGILDGIFGKKDLMSDQIHPNTVGYALIAEKVEQAIKPYL